MVLAAPAAKAFIRDYSLLLAEVHRLSGEAQESELLRILAAGREALQKVPERMRQAVDSLKGRGAELSPEVLKAVGTLRLKQWVYLRDTTKCSILLAPEDREAFGVLGLTDPLRTLAGRGAVTFRTGVVEYGGKYVCDGLFSGHVRIGPNYRRDFEALFKAVKAEGGYRVASEL
jgi:hypothetical protein